MRAGSGQEQRKQQGDFEQLPSLRLGPGDLQTIETILKGYLNYTRQTVPSSTKRNKQMQMIEAIRHRFKTALLAIQAGGEVCVPLTYREFQAIDEALAGFIKMVRYRISVSREREETLADIELMRQRIALVPMSSTQGVPWRAPWVLCFR